MVHFEHRHDINDWGVFEKREPLLSFLKTDAVRPFNCNDGNYPFMIFPVWLYHFFISFCGSNGPIYNENAAAYAQSGTNISFHGHGISKQRATVAVVSLKGIQFSRKVSAAGITSYVALGVLLLIVLDILKKRIFKETVSCGEARKHTNKHCLLLHFGLNDFCSYPTYDLTRPFLEIQSAKRLLNYFIGFRLNSLTALRIEHG